MMGFEDSPKFGNHFSFMPSYDEYQQRLVREAHQHTKAVWLLADYSIPPDTREMAQRWSMEETLVEMWRQAFIAGWRAAHKEVKDG